MIIVGYQGIGKSTLANKDNKFIDLESGNFWVDGKRDEKWYILYCNIAAHLSSQGFDVFVSSHEVVRKELLKYYNEQKMIIVCPSVKIKDQWIDKLKKRYEETGLYKDYKAYMNAADRYEDNIRELMASEAFLKIVIDSIEYDLEKLLNDFDYDYISNLNLMGC